MKNKLFILKILFILIFNNLYAEKILITANNILDKDNNTTIFK